MLVSKAAIQPGEWVLLWGIGSGVATAACRSQRLSVHMRSSRPRATRSSPARATSARTPSSTTPRATSSRRSRRRRPGRGADIVLEHVGEATWQRTLQAVRAGGRITVCGATSGPNPPAALHRIWWKQLTVFGSTMGTKADFEGAYELIASGRARPVVDRVFPLSESARRARIPRSRPAAGQGRPHHPRLIAQADERTSGPRRQRRGNRSEGPRGALGGSGCSPSL